MREQNKGIQCVDFEKTVFELQIKLKRTENEIF